MTDKTACGSCDLACADGEDCVAGHCVDTSLSCAVIKQYDPAATDGPYTHKTDGTQFYCDMTNMLEYDALGFGQGGADYNDFSPLGAADLQAPQAQQAFIWLYNLQAGFISLDPGWGYPGGSCCAIRGTSGPNMDLAFNSMPLEPADATGTMYECLSKYPDNKYRFVINGSFPPLTLPTDYFSTMTIGEINNCTDNDNPMLFWNRHP
jgi:hypothetical protein